MPNTKSAKKRLRQSLERRSRNRSEKSSVKSQLRQVREAITAGKLADAETGFRTAQKKLDQAAAGGAIHKNAAARLKSRLSARLKAAKTKAGAKA